MTHIMREGKLIQKDGVRLHKHASAAVDPATVPSRDDLETVPNTDPASSTYGKPQPGVDASKADLEDADADDMSVDASEAPAPRRRAPAKAKD